MSDPSDINFHKMCESVRAAISPERLSGYLAKANQDLPSAIELYDWNIEIGSAFSSDLQRLEILIRNAIHTRLTLCYSDRWYDEPGLLHGYRKTDIATARRRLQKPETPGRIVAELNFGFWRFLLTKHYHDTIWYPAARLGFPEFQPARRPLLEKQVAHLHQFRNRIAHCEPIFKRDLRTDALLIHTVAGYISPECA